MLRLAHAFAELRNSVRHARVSVPLLLAGIVTVSAVPYALHLRNGFVWLDHAEIVDRGVILNGASDFWRLLLGQHQSTAYFRPLYHLIHSLDHALWGEQPLGYHLSSLVLHVANACIISALATRMGFGRWPSLALAALWAAHPVNTVAVGLIHAKADLAVTFLLAGALWTFLAVPERRGAALSIAFLLLALLTKETAYAYAPAVLLMAGPLAKHVRHVKNYVFCAFLATLVAGVHRILFSGAQASVSALELGERLATFGTVYVDYMLRLAYLAAPSVSDVTLRAGALRPAAATAYGVAFACVVALQLVAVLRVPRLRPWIVIYNLSLLPVAQIVPALHFRADRFLYLPSIAFVGAALECVKLLTQRRSFAAVQWAAIAGVLVACNLSNLDTLQRFGDDAELFTYETTREPHYREGLAVLAKHFERDGEPAMAAALYSRSLESDPRFISYLDHGAVVLNLSSSLLQLERWADAREVVAKHVGAVRDPELRALALYNQAIAERRLGRPGVALAYLEQFIEAHPNDAHAHYVAALCAAGVGRHRRAIELMNGYLRLEPRAADSAEVRARINGWRAL